VADMAFGARAAELETLAVAARSGGTAPALERAVRELLAIQASDWGFLVARELAGDYPLERVRGHAAAHDAALRALTDSPAMPPAPEPALRNLAPHLDLAPLLAP
jgi:predicted glycosyl hydrolase (DUF1957 family)